MYINPFWLGVFTTLGAECAAVVAAAIVSLIQKKKGEKDG